MTVAFAVPPNVPGMKSTMNDRLPLTKNGVALRNTNVPANVFVLALMMAEVPSLA